MALMNDLIYSAEVQLWNNSLLTHSLTGICRWTCHLHFHSIEVARFLFARWRACGPAGHVGSARRDSPLLPRGRAGVRTYKRI